MRETTGELSSQVLFFRGDGTEFKIKTAMNRPPYAPNLASCDCLSIVPVHQIHTKT